MAKVKIELDLDWITEDGDIDQTIKDEVIGNLQSKFTAKAEQRANEILEQRLGDITSKVSDEFLEKVMQEKINNLQIPYKTSDWRSEVQILSLSEFVGIRYEDYLKRKVFDKDGNSPRYQSDATVSIHEFFINKFLEKELIGKVNALIKKARQEAEETVIKTLESNLKVQLSADIINRLNIPHLLKSLQEKAASLESGELQ